jgi:8-oxo-dGTP pyrophosphatase MutT (NUDIX family)
MDAPTSTKRVSAGIACCRVRDGVPEILMAKRRLTYAFCEFVHGHYPMGDRRKIVQLLSEMSVTERIDVCSLDFSYLWYKIWLYRPVGEPVSNASMFRAYGISLYERYDHKRRLYENTVQDQDGFFTLVERASRECRGNAPEWTFPKGRVSDGEDPRMAAMREFEEESGLKSNQYRLLPIRPLTYSINAPLISSKFARRTSPLITSPLSLSTTPPDHTTYVDEAGTVTPLPSISMESAAVQVAESVAPPPPRQQYTTHERVFVSSIYIAHYTGRPTDDRMWARLDIRQISEIEYVEWMSLERARVLLPSHMYKYASNALKIYRKNKALLARTPVTTPPAHTAPVEMPMLDHETMGAFDKPAPLSPRPCSPMIEMPTAICDEPKPSTLMPNAGTRRRTRRNKSHRSPPRQPPLGMIEPPARRVASRNLYDCLERG